jgi:subtilisin family serine protease
MRVRPVRVALVVVTLVAGLVTAGASFTPIKSLSGTGSVVPGEIIVGLDAGGDVDAVARGVGASNVRALLGGNAYVLEVKGDPFGIAAQARGLTGVRYAEPNFARVLHQAPDAPDDGGFGLKWDLHNDGTHGTADADIDWLEAYDLLGPNPGLSDVVVAVLDTGIDAAHPDLNDKLAAGGYDFISNDTTPQDGFGHGTHVAGIAVGETNNGSEDSLPDTASVGYASSIKVMPIKVCDDNGSCPTDAIVNGIRHAADKGARVINLSLGGPEISQAEIDAIDYAYNQKGVLIVASAGNSNTTTKSYPAAHEPVMAIAATNSSDGRASYSNYGADWVDLAAPGGQMSTYDDPGGIYSTMPTYGVYLTSCRARGLLSPCYDTHYDQLQGTSMAAPQVAGAAALLFAVDKTLTNAEVRSALETNADAISGTYDPDSPTASLWANGRLNVYNAVLAVTNGEIDAPPTVSITSPADGASFSSGESILFDGSASDTEDGDLTASLVWTSNLDGQIGTGGSFIKVLSDGTHVITASVTDSGGNTGSDSITITVGDTLFTLDVNFFKVRGEKYADLTWSGATSTDVYVYRDGSLIATTANNGAYQDGPLGRGGGSATYQVCEAGTETCSNTVSGGW